MQIKKIIRIVFIFCLFLFCLKVSANANEEVTANVEKINSMYLKNDYWGKLVIVSDAVFSQPHYYDNNTKAKLYSMLSNKAVLDGDFAKAFELVTQGLALSDIDVQLKLTLILTLAESYYVNGKYEETLQIANQAIVLANTPGNLPYRLIALGYRAIAYTLIEEHQLALSDLNEIEQMIARSPAFSNNFQLLETLALAQFHLGDYLNAIELQNQVIQMKAKDNLLLNIENNYYYLALAYNALNRNDDAYNALWQAKEIAESLVLPYRLGDIVLGLGMVQLEQGAIEKSYSSLRRAKTLFTETNRPDAYLKALTLQAKAAKASLRYQEAEQLLLEAEQLSEKVLIKDSEIELYYQLYLLYQAKKDYAQGIKYLALYLARYKATTIKQNKTQFLVKTDTDSEVIKVKTSTHINDNLNADELNETIHFQQQLIIALGTLSFFLFLLAVVVWLRKRTFQLTTEYNDNERPADYLCSPSQTKHFYQLNYKKARKYEYSLAIGYMMVSNWHELNALVNKKVIDEISRTIACLINEYTGEYDYVGKLNDGQYLILCPYQTSEEIALKLKSITEALAIRSFANLGDFSINIGYAFETPSVQDIDPYIFLSRLSERVSAKYSN